MRVAVLDLGTNTFNLIVAEQLNGLVRIIHSSKLPVKLGEGSINQGKISEQAFERAVKAIENHYQTVQNLQVEKIKALGTSGLRTARNGDRFIATIKEQTGIEIELIDGNREAELIWFGVRETCADLTGKYLILDIGGGSNEFILADNRQIYWKKSYKLGVARLLEKFKPSDPLQRREISSIMEYLEESTQDLTEVVAKHKVNVLVGASGSFETFASMVREDEIPAETETSMEAALFPIDLPVFENLSAVLIASTIAEREKMKGLEPMRIEMIVLACLFVKFILQKLGITQIYQTNYSLKEGVIFQLCKT
jgi:exopolyphosphatase / guanosine-5'-triphosphate,3'-diphosphate pyrophosphatase